MKSTDFPRNLWQVSLKQLNVKVSPDGFRHSHQFGKIQKPVLNSLFGTFTKLTRAQQLYTQNNYNFIIK